MASLLQLRFPEIGTGTTATRTAPERRGTEAGIARGPGSTDHTSTGEVAQDVCSVTPPAPCQPQWCALCLCSSLQTDSPGKAQSLHGNPAAGPACMIGGMTGTGTSGVMVSCLLTSAGLAGQMTGMTGTDVRPGSIGSTAGAATMREIMGHAPGAMSGPCPRLQPQPGMPECVRWPLGLLWTRSGVPTFLQVTFTQCRCVTCFRALLLSLLFSRAAEVHRAPSPALL